MRTQGAGPGTRDPGLETQDPGPKTSGSTSHNIEPETPGIIPIA